MKSRKKMESAKALNIRGRVTGLVKTSRVLYNGSRNLAQTWGAGGPDCQRGRTGTVTVSTQIAALVGKMLGTQVKANAILARI
jgi:hypothetical protein